MAAYWAQKPALSCKHAPLRKRLRLLDATVTTSLLWCCESWTTTKQQRDSLDVLQRWMVRDLISPKRQPDETWLDWHVRTLHAAKTHIDNHSRPWSSRIATQKANWAATLAARAHADPIKQTITWRNAAWRLQQQLDYGWRQQRRTNNIKWIRWEDSLVKQHGPDWQRLALTPEWRTLPHPL